MQDKSRSVYGGFWRRAVASLIDGLLIALVGLIGMFALGIIIGLVTGSTEPDAAWTAIGLISILVLYWLYETRATASDKQATLGKRAMGLKVIDPSCAQLAFGRASARFLAKLLSAGSFLIGFIMAAFTRRKLGLHDLIAHTMVVRQEVSANDLEVTEPERLHPFFVFLILLVGLVALPSVLFVDNTELRLFTQSETKTREMAEQGNPKAQFNLGNAYLKGNMGLERNPEKASEWYRKSAEQGYRRAQYNLAQVHLKGLGDIPQDKSLAAEWMQKAAQQGVANAQYWLGIMIIQGEGVRREPKQGVSWVEKAASQGNEEAQEYLEK